MNCANHPDRERIAFCQNCGKPLCAECSRIVRNAVFCEPCLAARLTASESVPTGAPFTNVNVPLAQTGAPNPALAGLLGLIPGVGAMYNGQYAKGIVHLIVFAILVSLSDTNGVFGLFVAGWVFYQAIEAYQTASARRDGTPLPNPFGLNDIGEKLGFNKSWTGPAAPPPSPPPYAPVAPPDASGVPFAQTVADTQSYPRPAASTPNWGTPPAGSYAYTASPVPPASPYGTPFTPIDPLPPAGRNFPMGALFLIGLGLLFFLGSTGLFHHFPIQRLLPFFIIALGVWIFVRKMTGLGFSMTDDGSPAYRLRLFRALHSSIWVILVGILFFLDTFDILSWSHSWPVFIIVAGLMSVFRGSAFGPVPPAPYPYPGTYPGTAAPYPPAAPAAAVEPVAPHDEEGR